MRLKTTIYVSCDRFTLSCRVAAGRRSAAWIPNWKLLKLLDLEFANSIHLAESSRLTARPPVPQCAVINCRQSVVYAGDRRSNLVRQAPLFGNKPQRTVSFPNLILSASTTPISRLCSS